MSADAKLEKQLEQGDYQVLGIEGADQGSGTAFRPQIETIQSRPHLRSGASWTGSGLKALTTEEGQHFANFSDDGKH